MSQPTRREFLKQVASLAGAAGLSSIAAACSRGQATPQPSSVLPLKETQPIVETLPGATTTPLPDNLMAVVRNGEPEQLVRKALEALGGIERFVKPGNDVIIKPNICVSYMPFEAAATTNPWTVAALVRLCLEAGARNVRVMDNPFDGSAQDAYAFSGIQQQVEANGGRMEIMSPLQYVKVDLPEGRDFHSTQVYDQILDADVVINVPIAKDHGLAKLTLGMKNMLGVVQNRPGFHGQLGQRLADLASRVRPTLTIIDAVRILTYGGPTGGDYGAVKKLDTIIASTDIVAADAYAATLFGMTGNDLDYVKAGAEMGLGNGDLGRMKIEEINLAA